MRDFADIILDNNITSTDVSDEILEYIAETRPKDQLDIYSYTFPHPNQASLQIDMTEMISLNNNTILRTISMTKNNELNHTSYEVMRSVSMAAVLQADSKITDDEFMKSIIELEQQPPEGLSLSYQTKRETQGLIRGISMSHHIPFMNNNSNENFIENSDENSNNNNNISKNENDLNNFDFLLEMNFNDLISGNSMMRLPSFASNSQSFSESNPINNQSNNQSNNQLNNNQTINNQEYTNYSQFNRDFSFANNFSFAKGISQISHRGVSFIDGNIIETSNNEMINNENNENNESLSKKREREELINDNNVVEKIQKIKTVKNETNDDDSESDDENSDNPNKVSKHDWSSLFGK